MKSKPTTRFELWKEYREEIYRNGNISELASFSDDKFNLLYSRLKKVFPDYEKFFPFETTEMDISANFEQEPLASSLNLVENLISEIDQIEKKYEKNIFPIDTVSFTTKDPVLTETISLIKKGKMKDRGYVNISNSNEIVFDTRMKEAILMIDTTTKPFINVAIDGPSGSGKSTIAKKIAQKYRLTYINSGSLYRAVALYMYRNNFDVDSIDDSEIKNILSDIEIEVHDDEVMLNGSNVSTETRLDIISKYASKVAAINEIRAFVNNKLFEYVKSKGIVMDGRDTTTRIMPDAEVRIYLDTSPVVRAKRRYDQNISLGFESNYEQILEEIKERDQRDKTREKDPLRVADGVTYIDASNSTIEQVVAEIGKLIESEIKK